jgi:energy-coupling factor transporter transmembrane protein EcfT
VTVPQKLFFCFLFSPFLLAGIAVFVFTGILDYPAGAEMRILMFTAIFLTLFLIIFFCFNLSNKIITHQELSAESEYGEPERAAELEDISGGHGGSASFLGTPFAFSSDNPELLPVVKDTSTEISGEVIYEHKGIHYINNDIFYSEKNTAEKLNNNFAKLVESVVKKV